jgi:hypothetical protein
MKRLTYILILLIITAAFSLTASAQAEQEGRIQGFKAQDAPFDDGTGIMLSWKPLPRDMRIIQYRVYRGVSPYFLFYFGQVEVDPTAGVASDMMYYYDKDFQMFLSIDSPAKLKKEKQQRKGSPLYGRIPRDPVILDRLFPHYTILGIFNGGNLYKRSVKVTQKDGTVSAGLKPTHFEQLAANPKEGKTYFYTVLAVDEKGKLLPHAEIQSAVPVDNPPDNTARLASVYLTDTRELRLEWLSPASSYDIAQWQFWLLPKSQRTAFDQWQSVYLQNEGAPAPWTSNAVLLAEKPNDYSNYLILKTQNNRIVNPDGSPGASLPANAFSDYDLVLGYQDYSGYSAYVTGNPVRLMTSEQMPSQPVFTVMDKPDDKGDTNAISFGLPICFITQAAYLDAQKSKVRINYEISDNEKHKIEAVSFKVSDGQGKLLKTIEERYPDKIVVLKLDKGTPEVSNLQVEMAFRFRGEKAYTEYYVHQNLSYDVQTRRFTSDDIYYKGENLSRNYYQIFRKSKMQDAFYPTKKISTISRNYDDIVSFETTLDRVITGIDIKTGTLLIEPTLTFAVDKETGMPLSVNIYRDEELKELQQMQDEIASLKTQLAEYPSKADSLNAVILEKETYLNALMNHPVYQQSLKVTNQRKWLSLFHREQQINNRSYSYMIMKTDTEGAYTFSEESEPFMPVPQWFNWNFLIALIATILFTGIVVFTSFQARRGKDLYLRPIAGLQEIDNAVGRATEMGRPILYVPGWSTIGEITTIASMMILNKVAKKAAEYDTRIIVPNNDYYVMPLAQEMVREAFYEAGRPDSYNPIDIFYISSDQFPWAAGINGTMIREKTATNFYMGFFNAEALLMTETGNATGSIQIAGTDAITQVPFFITTCDYTLIGEEFYAASAYMSKDAELVAMLKAQDYFKFLIIFFVLLGAILATFHFNWLTNSFPLE